MNRLVRIALTMFVSATILFLLVANRAKKARDLQLGPSRVNPATMAIVEKELQMAWLGVVIGTGLVGGGVVLLITVLIRNRKKPEPTPPNIDG
ncbi:hypothetical protein [Haloferula sp. BvORR071]|uniref:hypothetical protein n=1 Tax=Haloferula sp. BvORR071 TaxID=1396141 RepID=UPI00054FBBA8|nr:hypothetical protein [Haloferula sp. BvORR071]